MNGKIQKIISLIIILIFVFCDFSIDVLYLQSIPVSVVKLKTVSTVHADVYCLPPNEGGQTPVFDPVIGFCTLPPLDSYGKCAAPYVYSTTNKVCILTPICSGAEYWDADAKQCVAYTGGGSVPGDTIPVFPDNSCAVDLNGNGEVEQDEIFQCTQTPQGYICPQGQAECNPQYTQPTCPAGYTYNSQTQKCEATVTQGSCSSAQVPYTDYQCPTTGQIYLDLTTCNNNCIQTAQCNLTNTPVSVSGSGDWTDQFWSWYFSITGSGSQLIFYGLEVDYSDPYSPYFPYAHTYIVNVPGANFSGKLENDFLECSCVDIYVSGNQLVMRRYCCWWYGGSYYSYLNFSNVSISGGYTGIGGYTNYDTVRRITATSNYIDLSNRYAGSFGRLYFYRSTYTCPLGNYPCTGDPPTCTRGQTCVTHTDYTTKWRCSLDGVQYDTQSQCITNCRSACPAGGSYNSTTGKCEANATCSTGTLQSQGCLTGYSCPLGNYQCQQVGSRWMCSPYQCITQSQIQDEGDIIASGLENDGERDASGNCLGTVYIFNGKKMRCRKSGVQTGFHNCCNESRGKLYDSTGSTGLTSIPDMIKTIAAVYSVLKFGYNLANSTTVYISLIDRTVTVNGVNYALNSAEGVAAANAALQYGIDVTPPGLVGELTIIDIPQSAKDGFVGAGIGNYIQELGPQIAWAIAQLALSRMVKDPVLSSAVNLVGKVALMALGKIPVNYYMIAFQVISLAMSLFMKRCDSQDIETSTFNDSRYCHEVGEYCVKKWPLVGCVQKARGFCCFNSKLARIIHEQGRPQLAGFGPGGGWGQPKNPNCRGFLPEEFQALDFNKIDLSEYVEDIQRNIRTNLQQDLQQQFNQTMQDLTGY